MKVYKAIFLCLSRLVYLYLVFALLATELNPFEWHAWVRIIFALITIGVTTVQIHEQIENNDE